MTLTRPHARDALLATAFVLALSTVSGAGHAAAMGARATSPAAGVSPSDGVVYSTSLLTSTHRWAAGYAHADDNTVTPMAAEWVGASWRLTKTRLPSGFSQGLLQGIDALTTDDVWAVGSSIAASGATRTLAEHWDGHRWSVMPTEEPPGVSSSSLQSVTALAADDVWAVGYFYDSGDGGSIIEHWDGSAWSLVRNADPAGAYKANLQAVTAISPTDIWATGYFFDTDGAADTLVEHWNGQKWKLVTSPDVPNSPDSELHAVSAASSGDVWATGFAFTGSTYITLVEHWDGSHWSIVDSPNPPASTNTYLYGVAAVKAKNVWATGYYFSAGEYHTLAEHWRNSSWSVVDTPGMDGGSNYLFGVDAVSRDDIWAGGFAFTDHDVPFTDHWNGHAWVLVELP